MPWGDDIETSYAPDLRAIALAHPEIVRPPGKESTYNNHNPLLVGMVISVSRHVGVELHGDESLATLGVEHDATWSLDSARSGFEKMESGLNATAVDYARSASSSSMGGTWVGRQVVSEDWIGEATAAGDTTDPQSMRERG